MNVTYAPVIDAIEGHWAKMSDTRAEKLTAWLDRRQVPVADVLNALDALIDDGLEYSPKTPQIAKKLRELGTIVAPPLGIGDPGVIGRMKTDITQGIWDLIEVAPQWTFDARLRLEEAQAETLAEEDAKYELGSADYWRDRLLAFRELRDPLSAGYPTTAGQTGSTN
jgi:hypothetical protein